jgi:hypothetical protein
MRHLGKTVDRMSWMKSEQPRSTRRRRERQRGGLCSAGPWRLCGRPFRSAVVSRAPQGPIPRCILWISTPCLYAQSALFLLFFQRLRTRVLISRARPPAPTRSQRVPLGRSTLCARTLVFNSTYYLFSPSSSSPPLTRRAQVPRPIRSRRGSRAETRPSTRSRASATRERATPST